MDEPVTRTDDFRRKLVAILCADVAGYTRLMAGQESATHAAYKACLEGIVKPALNVHRGRVVKSTGDGFIAVFDSVIDSLACALAIQNGLARKDAGSTLRLRIGVNIGDIIEEEDDVFGDGVNQAARLQALAKPGGVCVSALLRDQVRGKLNVKFESLGRKRVKKNDIPLDAYAVSAETAPVHRFPSWRIIAQVRSVARRHWVKSLSTITICAAALVAWQGYQAPMQRLVSLVTGQEPSFLALPDRPSLVVLPFRSIGSGEGYFADGITDDIITDLVKVDGLFVISRTSSFAYKSRSQDVRQIGRDLGVRYALKGSVRRAENTVRIDAQLVDARSGGHVWAARFDRPLGDVFKIQDEITDKIVTALSVKLTQRDQARPANTHTDSMAAYDAYLRGWEAYRHNTYQDYQRAIEYFQSAIALDSGFAQAHAAIAAAYLATRLYSLNRVESFTSRLQIVINSREHDRELLEKAKAHVALALRNPTSLAYRSSAEILLVQHEYDQAIAQIRKAVALDPNDADNFAMLSATLVWDGKAEAAIEPIKRAIRLNPYHPSIYLCHYGSALFSLGRYAEAKKLFERCKAGNAQHIWPYIYLIATYAYLGEEAKAAAARKRATEILTSQDRSLFTVKEVRNHMPYRYQADLLRLLVGLHKGHVPDSFF